MTFGYEREVTALKKGFTESQCFSNFEAHQNHLEGLVQLRLLSCTRGVPDPVGLRWGLRMCISNQSPGGTDAVGLGPLCEPLA